MTGARSNTGDFGSQLREIRKASGKTLVQFARALGVKAAYLSEVERNNKAPLTADRIDQAASLLGLTDQQVASLRQAASLARNQFRLTVTDASAIKRAFAADLERGWHHLSDDDVLQMRKILHNAWRAEARKRAELLSEREARRKAKINAKKPTT